MKSRNLAALILLLVLITGCRGTTSTVVTPAAATSVARSDAKANWQQKWDETVAAAKKEGQVRFSADAFPQHGDFKQTFEKKFGIELEISTMRGAELTPKIMAERSAGLYTWDVFSTGPTIFLFNIKPGNLVAPLEPTLILPEVTDPKAWRGGQLPFLDKDRMALGYNSLFYRGALINTDMVKPDQLSSLNDLLRPEWKKKIVLDDIAKPGPGTPWLLLLASSNDFDFSKVREFLVQLVKQEPVITSDYRVNLEWIARGKYPILVGYDTGAAADFKAKGAPITLARLKEGSVVGSFGPQNVSLPSVQRPHPNAAIVFVNWLLSQEGQTAYVKSYAGAVSARLDVSAAGIDPAFLEVPGEKLFQLNEKMFQSIADLRKLAGEVLPK